MTSVIGIGLSCAVSVAVPFFDIIIAAIGALGDLAAAYALPALFVLVSLTLITMNLESLSQDQKILDVSCADLALFCGGQPGLRACTVQRAPKVSRLDVQLHAAAQLCA